MSENEARHAKSVTVGGGRGRERGLSRGSIRLAGRQAGRQGMV